MIGEVYAPKAFLAVLKSTVSVISLLKAFTIINTSVIICLEDSVVIASAT